jgi:hypothetical protein
MKIKLFFEGLASSLEASQTAMIPIYLFDEFIENIKKHKLSVD